MRIKDEKLQSSKADWIMKYTMPQTQPSLQNNVIFFLQAEFPR